MLFLEYTFLLDHMDRRNIVRFAFWLTSLTANQKIFMTIEKAFERDFSKGKAPVQEGRSCLHSPP